MGLKEDIVKVVDVLKIASLFLNLEKEFEPYFERILAGETNFTENSETIEEMKLCLKCFNLVYQEIANDYFPLKVEEKVTPNDFKVYFKDFSHKAKDIYSIFECETRRRLKYKEMLDYIFVGTNNKVKVVYSKQPSEFMFADLFEDFNGRISAKCLALGVASEYCFIKNFFDEAQVWEQRFKNALKVEGRKKGEILLRKRRWQ